MEMSPMAHVAAQLFALSQNKQTGFLHAAPIKQLYLSSKELLVARPLCPIITKMPMEV
jgi:hypothetical protein